MGFFEDLERVVIGQAERLQLGLEAAAGGWEAAALQKDLKIRPGGLFQHPEGPVEQVVGAVLDVDLFAQEIDVDQGAGAAAVQQPLRVVYTFSVGINTWETYLPRSVFLIAASSTSLTLASLPDIALSTYHAFFISAIDFLRFSETDAIY